MKRWLGCLVGAAMALGLAAVPALGESAIDPIEVVQDTVGEQSAELGPDEGDLGVVVQGDSDENPSGTCGTCQWAIDSEGTLTIGAGTLEKASGWPWRLYASTIKSMRFDGAVVACEDLSYMFSYCSQLKSIDFTGLDTSSVTLIHSMFLGCSSLPSVDLSGLNTTSLKQMGYMFGSCSKLRTVDLSSLKASPVTSMDYMFYGCASLERLDLSGFDTSSVTDMSCMFNGCSSLTMIDVGKGWTTSSVNTGNDMFSGCTSLVGGAGTAYGAKDPALAATVTGTLGSDTVSYQLSRAAGEGVGSYAITASGKATQGNYSVTFRGATLTIKAASVSGASVSAIGEKPYTGKAIKPKPKVTLGGRKLKLGTDYTIKYASNKKVGTATVTITGKGNYCGSKVVKFKIVKAKNPMTAKVVTKTAKLSTLKGKAVSVVPITVSKAKGDVTYTKVSKGSSKYLKVNAKTGRVTVAKGTKRGTYKIRVKVTAAGNGSYKKATKTVTCKVTVR